MGGLPLRMSVIVNNTREVWMLVLRDHGEMLVKIVDWMPTF